MGSHLKMKELLCARKQIKPKEIFTSPDFLKVISDIGTATGKRYKKRIKYNLEFAPEKETTGYTDNNEIYINTANALTSSLKSLNKQYLSLLGLLGHETGHLLYTDFVVLENHMKMITDGDLGDITDDLKNDSRYLEIISKLKSKEKNAITVLVSILKDINNILEDGYIEKVLICEFPGFYAEGIILNNSILYSQHEAMEEFLAEQTLPLCILMNFCIQYVHAGEIKALNHAHPLCKEFLVIKPYIDLAVNADESEERWKLTNSIAVILWDYIKPLLEKQEKLEDKNSDDENNSESGDEKNNNSQQTISENELKEILDKLKKQINKGSAAPKGNTTPADTPGDESNSAFSSQEGNSTVNTPSLSSELAKKFTDILDSCAYKKAENTLADTLKLLVPQVSCSDEVPNQKIDIHRTQTIPNQSLNEYQLIANSNLIKYSKILQKAILKVLKTEDIVGIKREYSGKRLIAKGLHKENVKPFMRLKTPDITPNLSVAILVDESGSMEGQKIRLAKQACIVIEDFCRNMGIPLCIYGHDYDYSVNIYSYVDFDTIDNQDKYRLMEMCARNCNHDGYALRFIQKRLLARPEPAKLLILLSDGYPAADSYRSKLAHDDLQLFKKEVTRQSITFFAGTIDGDIERIRDIYGNCLLDFTDISKLPQNLSKLIAKQLII